jgi:hypothetical protein
MEIGVLEEDYSSEWTFVFPTFVIPKKIGAATIRVVTDFKKLCSMLRGKSQFMIVIYFRLFVELDLIWETGM